MTRGTRVTSAGFTLLEVLIAFTIATTTLGLLFRIHANSTATVAMSQGYREATTLAQALLEEHSVTERGLEFARTGSVGKFEWAVRGNPYSAALAASGAAGQPLYLLRRVTAEVSWSARDRDRRITIRTVKPFFAPQP